MRSSKLPRWIVLSVVILLGASAWLLRLWLRPNGRAPLQNRTSLNGRWLLYRDRNGLSWDEAPLTVADLGRRVCWDLTSFSIRDLDVDNVTLVVPRGRPASQVAVLFNGHWYLVDLITGQRSPLAFPDPLARLKVVDLAWAGDGRRCASVDANGGLWLWGDDAAGARRVRDGIVRVTGTGADAFVLVTREGGLEVLRATAPSVPGRLSVRVGTKLERVVAWDSQVLVADGSAVSLVDCAYPARVCRIPGGTIWDAVWADSRTVILAEEAVGAKRTDFVAWDEVTGTRHVFASRTGTAGLHCCVVPAPGVLRDTRSRPPISVDAWSWR